MLVVITLFLSLACSPAHCDDTFERIAALCRRGLAKMGEMLGKPAADEGPGVYLAGFDPASLQPKSVFGDFDAYSWAARLYGEPEINSFLVDKSAKEFTRKWARDAVAAIGAAPIGAKDKVKAYEKMVAELKRRLDEMQAAATEHDFDIHAKLTPWDCRKVEVGGGIVIFVGDIGKIVEIHPNGDVYRIDMVPRADENVMSPRWKPPYNADGTRDMNRFMANSLKPAV